MTFALFALLAAILVLVVLSRTRHAPVTSLRLAILWLATLVDAYVIWLLVVADVARDWHGMTGLLVFNVLLILCALPGPALFVAAVVATINRVRHRG
jgi:hypothetical protein